MTHARKRTRKKSDAVVVVVVVFLSLEACFFGIIVSRVQT